MRRRFAATLALACLLPLAACAGDERPSLQVQRDTVGDTVVVRTAAG